MSQQAPLSWVVEDQEPVQRTEPAEVIQPAEPAEPARIAEVAPSLPQPALAAIPVPDVTPAWPPPELASAQSLGAPAAPSWPAHPTWPPPRMIDLVEPAQAPAARIVAGAYLPPSAVLPPGEALPLAAADRRDEPEETVARPARERTASRKIRLSLGDGTGPLGMPAEAPARIVVLGAGVSGFGFLLPWATYVIGNGKIGGYLDQWGLAGPGHMIILALIAGIALLALFAAQMPRWVRVGLPSICLSFLLTGLVWPYLVGPYDALIGVYVVAAGAVVMIAGGLLDRIATRHAESMASV